MNMITNIIPFLLDCAIAAMSQEHLNSLFSVVVDVNLLPTVAGHVKRMIGACTEKSVKSFP